LEYIDIGKSEGADLVFGGNRATSSDTIASGLFIEPTIFAGVQNGSRLAQEEIFGPVACLIRFSGEEEAISLANDTDYGLAAGVWTSNLERAHRMTLRIRAGTIWVNNYRVVGYNVPFGGLKQSGLGRELGVEALNDYSEAKSVWIDLGNRQSFGRH
jgi:aldehyde dehydrogenase (NAD+)